jgi:hypothetical protein
MIIAIIFRGKRLSFGAIFSRKMKRNDYHYQPYMKDNHAKQQNAYRIRVQCEKNGHDPGLLSKTFCIHEQFSAERYNQSETRYRHVWWKRKQETLSGEDNNIGSVH